MTRSSAVAADVQAAETSESARLRCVVQQRQAVAWQQQCIVALSCVRAARVEGGERCVFGGSRAHLAYLHAYLGSSVDGASDMKTPKQGFTVGLYNFRTHRR